MSRWYALTPQDVLLSGNGNIIDGYIDNLSYLQQLKTRTRENYIAGREISLTDFFYPFICVLAATDSQINSRLKPIISLGQAMSFIYEVAENAASAEITAIRFYNGIMAAKFAMHANERVIAEKITDALLSGELLLCPQDRAALNNPAIADKLPCIMRYLLTKEQIKQQSFRQYLRKGTPPEISHKLLWADANSKKYISNCNLEFAFEKNYLEKGSCISYEEKKASTTELLEVLKIIYKAMLGAEDAARKAADEHLVTFTAQVSEKFGIIPHIADEPYLEAQIRRFELRLLEKLHKFLNMVERRAFAKKEMGWSVFNDDFYATKAAFDPKEPLIPQVEDKALLETSNMKGQLKQALDKNRQ